MRLKTLYLRNFRNYQEEVVHFSPKLNYIYGSNAQGKTNLLEAISLLMTGRSFRTHHLHELIRFGAPSFYLEAHFEKNGVDQVLKMGFDGISKTLIYNATPLSMLSAILGILNGVILSPEDNALIKGGPAERRHFLDIQLAKTHPLYLHHLSRYLKAMKQRNVLLKTKTYQTIDIWEEQMALSATFLTIQRGRIAKEIERSSAPFQSLLSQTQEELKLHYSSSKLAETKEDALHSFFLSQFEKLRDKESLLGNTLTGPHRDDLSFLINAQPAKAFASEGQQRTCTASLRLAEWSLLKAHSDELPFMCIDDIGISLDQKRETILLDLLSAGGQVFITSPRFDTTLPNTFSLHIANGKIITEQRSFK